MNALKTLKTPISSTTATSRRVVPLQSRQTQSRQTQSRQTPKAEKTTRSNTTRKRSHLRSYRPVALETLVKVVVNGILSTAAFAALGNLLPYYWSQQAQLEQVQTQVEAEQKQVEQLRNQVSRSFDPAQAQNVLNEQSAMLAPNQRRVILTNQDR